MFCLLDCYCLCEILSALFMHAFDLIFIGEKVSNLVLCACKLEEVFNAGLFNYNYHLILAQTINRSETFVNKYVY